MATRRARPRRQTNQRPSRINSRVEAGVRDEPVTPLLRQRVDLEDLDFALDHGHVAGVAQRTVRRGTGHLDIDVVGEPMLGVATTLSAGAEVGTHRS
ncbi:MAG: hypothetical protein ACRDZO_26790 [Egibacteraceae bacterium]